MSGSSSVLAWSSALEDFALFRTLSSEQRLKTLDAMVRQDLVRGRNAGRAGRSVGLAVHGAAWRAGGAQDRRSRAVRRASRRRTGRRNRLLRQCPAHRRCDRHPRHQRAGADARRPTRSSSQEAPAIVEALLAALARRFAKETARLAAVRASPKARTVALIDGGREPLPGAFDRRMREALAAHRCRDRRPRPRRGDVSRARAGCARSHRLAQRARTRPRRWWFISAAAKPRPGRARRSVRPTWSCSRAAAMRPPRALTEVEAFACEVHPVIGAAARSHS